MRLDFAWRDDRELRTRGCGQALQQPAQVTRQLDRFGAQILDARAVEQLQRRDEGRKGKNRRVADLPAVGAGPRDEVGLELHAEPRGRVVAPPAAVAGEVEALAVLLVNETSRDGAGPAVQVLVRTPRGEIDVPVVQA